MIYIPVAIVLGFWIGIIAHEKATKSLVDLQRQYIKELEDYVDKLKDTNKKCFSMLRR